MHSRRSNALRPKLLASSILGSVVLSAALAAPACAQDAEEQPTQIDEVVVTGSRIPRPNLTETTPVQVVGQEDLTNQGFENVTDLLTQLPQFAAAFGTSRTQSTFSGAAASGLNLTNLRNLGPQRSLTLVNGRRFPGGSILSEAVDFNSIPSANIERVEVITGGASAIYGADAIAGVINIILDDDFEGLEIGASYGAALSHMDNINPSAFIRFGSGLGDRGHATATLQYDYQGLVNCADRYLCAEDFVWFPPSDPIRGPAARSTVPLAGRFFVDGGPASGYTFRNGQMVTFDTVLDGYNRNADRTLAIPTKRLQFAGSANYQLTDNARAFLELNYSSNETKAPFEGHPFQSNAQPVSGVLEASIPANNPFIPASLRAVLNGDQQITWWQRFNGLGKRGATNLRQTSRLVLGVEGDLPSPGFGRDWAYEASYTLGRTTLDSRTEGLVSLQALYDSLRVEADPARPGQYRCVSAVARAQGCVPVNPFDGYNEAESASLTRSAGARGQSDLEVAQAFLNGTVADLWAGPLQVAVGVESRRTTAFLDQDSDINLGVTTGNQIFDNPSRTSRTNEVYGEFVLPLLADLPGAESLNLEGAYRVSDSSRYDTYETWKIGGDWTPLAGLRFRAARNRAVREPNLGEASGGGQTFGVVADPCVDDGRRTANATRAANCAADGVPVGYRPALAVEQGVGGFALGNPNLVPEEAETLSYGMVFQASAFEGLANWLQPLTVTLDRFEVSIDGLINAPGRQNLVNLCYDTPGAARAAYCSSITRGANPLVPGGNYVLLAVNDQLVNAGALDIAGIDLQVEYRLETDAMFGRDFGAFAVKSTFTRYDKAESQLFAGAATVDLLGFAGGSTSDAGYLKLQGNTSVTWTLGPWQATYVNRYIGEAKDSPFSATPVTIGDRFYHSLQAQYAVGEGSVVYVGVNNLMDTDPPFFPSGRAGTQALDTIPAYYDVIGRQLFAGFRARF